MKNFILAGLFLLLSTGVAGQVNDIEGSLFNPDSGIDEGMVVEMFECPDGVSGQSFLDKEICAAFAMFTFNEEGVPIWFTSEVFSAFSGTQVIELEQPKSVGNFNRFFGLLEIVPDPGPFVSPHVCTPFNEVFLTWPVTDEGDITRQANTMQLTHQVGEFLALRPCQ